MVKGRRRGLEEGTHTRGKPAFLFHNCSKMSTVPGYPCSSPISFHIFKIILFYMKLEWKHPGHRHQTAYYSSPGMFSMSSLRLLLWVAVAKRLVSTCAHCSLGSYKGQFSSDFLHLCKRAHLPHRDTLPKAGLPVHGPMLGTSGHVRGGEARSLSKG